MFKTSKIALAACGWAVLAVPAAVAADLPPIPVQPVPIPPAVMSAWYLRGDIGYSNQRVDRLDNVLEKEFDEIDSEYLDFEGAPIFGIGVGFRANRWFRADITGEYRAESEFDGLEIGRIGDDFVPNDYSARKSEWLALANGYIDLGSWRGVSPFVGAGIGVARVSIDDFTDICTTCAGGGVAFGEDESEWNFAWALHAGVGFEVTPMLTLEVAYRYVNLGDAESGDLKTFDGTNEIDNPMQFKDITSHDVRLGMRYQFP